MDTRRAFVIMPFSKTRKHSASEWTDIFENVFRPAFDACGYQCERAEISTGSLIKSILHELAYARVVLADLTDRNANVFYELGVRHSLSNRTIMVAQDLNDVPSDVRGHWCLEYGTAPGEVVSFKKNIARLVNEMDDDSDRIDSPVSEFLRGEQNPIRQFAARNSLKNVVALCTELSGLVNTLKEIECHPEFRMLIEHGCIDLLLNTLYIDVGKQSLADVYHLRHNLRLIRNGIRCDPAFISNTLTLSARVFASLSSVKQELSTGTFAEPAQLSTMIWRPTEHASEGFYSTAEDATNSRDNELPPNEGVKCV